MLSSYVIDTIESARRKCSYIRNNKVFVKFYNPQSSLITSLELDYFKHDQDYKIDRESNVLIIKQKNDTTGAEVVEHIDMSFISSIAVVIFSDD